MALTLSGTNKIVNDNLNTEVKTLFTPKNWIINGCFDVWQRGTSQTSSGYGSDDRFANLHDGISTKTHSRQTFVVGQTDVPNNPTYFSRTIVTSGNTSNSAVYKGQKIEDVTKLAGKIVTISFWAKADSNKNMAIFLLQNFGSGGSSDAVATIQKFALTTSWQRFTKTVTIPSAIGKTIGANSFLHLHMFFDAGSAYNPITDSLGNQSGTFDIANVSLVEGSVPVEWQTERYADVLRQCQRYYVRIKGLGTNAYPRFSLGVGSGSSDSYHILEVPAPMNTVSSIGYNAVSTSAGGAQVSVSSITIDDVVGNKISIRVYAGTYSNGTCVLLQGAGNTSAYIEVNAEL